MISKSYLHFGLVMLTASLAFAAEAPGDVRLRYTNSTPAVNVGAMTMPARLDTLTYWVAKGVSRADGAERMSIIYNVSSGVRYTLYNKFQLYSVSAPKGSAVDSLVPTDSYNLFEEGLQQLRPHVVSKMTETDSVKVIKGYHCRKYLVESHMTDSSMIQLSEIWATEDIKVDTAALNAVMYSSATPSGSSLQPKYDEWRKIKGVTVVSISKVKVNMEMMKIPEAESVMELIDVNEEPAPAGCYEVPKDYELYKE